MSGRTLRVACDQFLNWSNKLGLFFVEKYNTLSKGGHLRLEM